MFQRIPQFLSQVIQELRLINWPSRIRAIRLTGIVLGVCIVLGIYIGIIDYALTQLIAVIL